MGIRDFCTVYPGSYYSFNRFEPQPPDLWTPTSSKSTFTFPTLQTFPGDQSYNHDDGDDSVEDDDSDGADDNVEVDWEDN